MSNPTPPVRYTVRPVCGIYFLWQGDAIVYIGQSSHVHFRAMRHAQEGEKVFDSYTVVEAVPENLDFLESEYVREHAPKYNLAFPMGGYWMTWDALAANSAYCKRDLRAILAKRSVNIEKVGRWHLVRRAAVSDLLLP